MKAYLIQIQHGDRSWHKWGIADGVRKARRYTRALQDALGDRYQVRRRPVDQLGRQGRTP